MLGVDDLEEEQVEIFLSTAIERHNIYLRKERGLPKPWTDSEPFKDWFFCNLYRKVDKTTKVLIDKAIKPNEDSPYLWCAIIISRFFSLINSIEVLANNNCFTSEEGWKKGIALITEERKTGPFTTGGFITNPRKGYAKQVAPFLIVKDIARLVGKTNDLDTNVKIVDQVIRKAETMEEVFNIFIKAHNTAGFMSYEYVTDLTYTKRYFGGNKPTDYYTWCNCTVGSLRGLKRLCGRKPESKGKVDIKGLTLAMLDKLSVRVLQQPWGMEYPISMREIEHWLCEYDKYSRIFNKEKRMKRRYKGRV